MSSFIEPCKAATIPFFFLMILAAFVSPAEAQGPVHRHWEVSLFGGGSFASDGTHETPVTGATQQTSRSVGLRFGAGYLVGGRITENRWNNWGVTLEYSFSNQPVTFTNLVPEAPSLSFGHSIHAVAYQILYYPRDAWSRLRPYVFAGPGVSLFQIEGASVGGVELSDPWKVTLSWGGGVKYIPRDKLGFVAQFSDAVSDVPRFGLPKTAIEGEGQSVPGFRPDGLMHQWQLSAGFLYQWDTR
jgi:opacity protein-like surface antigen